MKWLALLLLCAQDDAGRWIEDLSSDSLIRRREAEEGLLSLGPPALPHLRPLLRSDDAELRGRAAGLIDEIERRERRVNAVGPVVRVTLEIRDQPFRDALTELERASGFQVWVAEKVENRRITLSLRDVPWLDAVSRLCRAHGKVRVMDFEYEDEAPGFLGWRAQDPDHRAHFALGPGTATNEPAVLSGPFRITISQVSESRSTEGDRFTLVLRRSWQPNARPIGVGPNLVKSVSDDGKRELLEKPEKIDLTPHTHRSPATYCWLHTLPSIDAEKMAWVKGRQWFWFGIEADPVVWQDPADKVGTSGALGYVTVRLEEFTGTPTGAIVAVKATWNGECPWNMQYLALGVLLRVRYLDGEGKDVKCSSSSGGAVDRNSATYRSWFTLNPKQAIRKIELRSWRDLWPVEVPFEFRDVPLPQW